jgi:hypothetical protein
VGLNPRAFDAFARALRPGDRFYVDVPEGSRGIFVTRAAVVRALSSFYLLPAIRVTERRRADVVLSYRFDGTSSVRRRR